MTNLQAIADSQWLQLSPVTQAHRYRWLDELDSLVDRELHAAFRQDFPVFTPLEGMKGRELLVKAPYDSMYGDYLQMRIFELAGQMEHYNNTLSRFQSAYRAYAAELCRSHASPRRQWNFGGVYHAGI